MSQNKYIYREGIISIFANLALFVLKLWAGLTSASVALIADAWHTLSDSISSVAVIVGTRLSAQKPDKEHPFGHGRWEYITAFLIALFLGFIAVEFVRDSVKHFLDHQSANFGTLAIVVTAISIVVKELLAQYALYMWRKTDNATVKADAWHHRSDALSSVVVLVGILLSDEVWWIDSALGILVAVILFYTAFGVVKESVSKILGEDISKTDEEKIQQIVADVYKDEICAHHFHLHNYGNHKELTLHVKLDPEMTIKEGHHIVTTIEKAIFRELGYITTIHIEEKNPRCR